jgi:hypothetical protein
MGSDIKKYHFANPYNNKIIEFAGKVTGLNTTLCFDLEDFNRNVSERKVDRKLHREYVLRSIKTTSSSHLQNNIGIRLNVFSSDEFYEDIELLERIKDNVKFDCLFLPKIENSEEIQECIEVLKKKDIHFSDIIPIIESKKAFNDLSNIIYASRGLINNVAFGHCDYNYDNSYFPFYHQDSEEYWGWINYLTESLQQYNILLVNSPFLSLNDGRSFLNMIKRLSGIAAGKFGQITLSLNQTRLCSLYEHNSFILPVSIGMNGSRRTNIKEIAESLIKDYENNLSTNRSFSVNADRIFISPQEYLSAKKCITKSETANV